MEIVDGIPVLEVVLENPLLSIRYPEEGCLLAILDTGYEGFSIIPRDLFKLLRFNELSLHSRNLLLPDGRLSKSIGTFGRITIPELKTFKDGFIETSEGVEEVVLGVEFAKGFKFTLDYCTYSAEIQRC